MQQTSLLNPVILNTLLNKLATEYEISVQRFLRENFEELAGAERYIFARYANMLEHEGLAEKDKQQVPSHLYMKITPEGSRVVELGGYIVWKERLAAEALQSEKDAELDRRDKRGSIQDRKFNRQLAWAAIIISLGTLGWTVYNDLFNK